MDNGATRTVSGRAQFLAYCNTTARPPKLLSAPKQFFRFGKTVTPSLGQATIRIPVSNGNFFEFLTDVVDIDSVPMLFGLRSRSSVVPLVRV